MKVHTQSVVEVDLYAQGHRHTRAEFVVVLPVRSSTPDVAGLSADNNMCHHRINQQQQIHKHTLILSSSFIVINVVIVTQHQLSVKPYHATFTLKQNYTQFCSFGAISGVLLPLPFTSAALPFCH